MEKEENGTEFTMETLGLEPDFSYVREPEKPGIQVDRLGYLPGSSKMAVFQGTELPESFQVVGKDSGECVYQGKRIRRRIYRIWQLYGVEGRGKLLYQM